MRKGDKAANNFSSRTLFALHATSRHCLWWSNCQNKCSTQHRTRSTVSKLHWIGVEIFCQCLAKDNFVHRWQLWVVNVMSAKCSHNCETENACQSLISIKWLTCMGRRIFHWTGDSCGWNQYLCCVWMTDGAFFSVAKRLKNKTCGQRHFYLWLSFRAIEHGEA